MKDFLERFRRIIIYWKDWAIHYSTVPFGHTDLDKIKSIGYDIEHSQESRPRST